MRSRSETRAAAHETNKVEAMIEKTRNSKLFAVFQAANATITRMTIKVTPPGVTSIGNRVRENSAKAERARGGTTRMVISKTKISEAIAPAPARLGAPSRRANRVNNAVANPDSTSSVPRIARPQRENKDEG